MSRLRNENQNRYQATRHLRNAGVFVVKVPSTVPGHIEAARKVVYDNIGEFLPKGWEFVLEVRK